MPSTVHTETRSCWVVTDGSAGMENQCIGLAETMGFDPTIKRIQTKKPWKWLPPYLWINPLSQLLGAGDNLNAPWPDLLITCGRQAIPMSVAIKRASAGKTFTVHIQTPNTNATNFDLVVVPDHDKLRGKNVLVSHGSLTRITNEKLKAEARKFEKDLKDITAPVVTVLVGGSNRCYDITPQVMRDLCQKLKDLHDQSSCFFLVTTSRRTGAENENILKEALRELPHILWSGGENNPYFAFLDKADHVIVTADSVNMVCEACTAGKQVLIYELSGGNRKFRHFHEKMKSLSHTKPFTGKLEKWTPPKLSETERIAALIIEKHL
ncbi:hypothetical protein A9Q83_03190 [Alphaproteobacteria bacterium 46_93_T64]|nr:hypothetical protein A9Q83_03190 [Alphaproteobacteria bacterium 46_93_T64]